jgi:hypothetical protein
MREIGVCVGKRSARLFWLALVLCIFTYAGSAQDSFRSIDADLCKKYSSPGFRGENISLDMANTKIRQVLEYFTDKFGINFVIDKSVRDEAVTIKVNDIPWNVALKSILESQELGITLKCPIFIVGKIGHFERGERGGLQTSPLYTSFITFKNLSFAYGEGQDAHTRNNKRTDFFAQLIKPLLSKRGSVEFDVRSSTVILTDLASRREPLGEFAEILDNSGFTIDELMSRNGGGEPPIRETLHTRNLFPIVICDGGRPPKDGDQPAWASDQGMLLFEIIRLPVGRWKNFSKRQLDIEGTQREINLAKNLINFFDKPLFNQEKEY